MVRCLACLGMRWDGVRRVDGGIGLVVESAWKTSRRVLERKWKEASGSVFKRRNQGPWPASISSTSQPPCHHSHQLNPLLTWSPALRHHVHAEAAILSSPPSFPPCSHYRRRMVERHRLRRQQRTIRYLDRAGFSLGFVESLLCSAFVRERETRLHEPSPCDLDIHAPIDATSVESLSRSSSPQSRQTSLLLRGNDVFRPRAFPRLRGGRCEMSLCPRGHHGVGRTSSWSIRPCVWSSSPLRGMACCKCRGDRHFFRPVS